MSPLLQLPENSSPMITKHVAPPMILQDQKHLVTHAQELRWVKLVSGSYVNKD